MVKSLQNSIGEIKEVNVVIGDELITSGIVVKEVRSESILLASQNQKLNLQSGERISLELFCSNGVYTFDTTVEKNEYNFPYIFLSLTSPSEFDVQQEREFYRTRFNLKALLTIIFHNEERQAFSCDTFDISGNGASLLVSPMLNSKVFEETLSRTDINKYARISLGLQFENREINALIEFVHKRKLNDNSDLMVYAFKFINLSPGDCDFITKQCFAKQLAEQNKSKN